MCERDRQETGSVFIDVSGAPFHVFQSWRHRHVSETDERSDRRKRVSHKVPTTFWHEERGEQMATSSAVKELKKKGEDAHVVLEGYGGTSCFAIFDGHGGTKACSHGVSKLAPELKALGTACSNAAIEDAFWAADAELGVARVSDGSTGTVLLVDSADDGGLQCVLAWVGDSQGAVVDLSAAAICGSTTRHVADDPAEERRLTRPHAWVGVVARPVTAPSSAAAAAPVVDAAEVEAARVRARETYAKQVEWRGRMNPLLGRARPDYAPAPTLTQPAVPLSPPPPGVKSMSGFERYCGVEREPPPPRILRPRAVPPQLVVAPAAATAAKVRPRR